ncbi:MAG: UvrD-helicase domain-containing protein [Streptosporangiaceae bacterium]
MPLYADLHIHSKYSRACSKDCDVEHLAWWASRKGLHVLGTGDFTHPAWCDHLRDTLVPAEPGLFRLRDDLEADVSRRLPPNCREPVRFMLSVEISTIYKRDDRTRKVHHLLYAPHFEAADAITRALAKIGNLASDGRPILGLDSRDLLEITLESDPGSYLVPAHIWTPWFSALGSKSGFDAVAHCYADLADHISAVETGLSSDPPMNWRLSALDRYRLVSNSDAHSPPMLGREATIFETSLDYFAIRRAVETGDGLLGTVEFFPQEGKYHLDGHRKCGVRLEPAETRARDARCPACAKPLTVGVLHRVEELADRPTGARQEGAGSFRNLVPLAEIIGEIRGVGAKSKRVAGQVADLVARLGPELSILEHAPLDDIAAADSAVLAEAIGRLRRGQVTREAGFDGEYGVIRLFRPGELRRRGAAPTLFELVEPAAQAPGPPAATERPYPAELEVAWRPNGHNTPMSSRSAKEDEEKPVPGSGQGAGGDVFPIGGDSLLSGLDPDQRAAAGAADGPLLIVAGPGTGKTRTLAHRIAHLLTERGTPPEDCLAITFTRRACEEMRDRLAILVPRQVERLTITTFHGLGVRILREQHAGTGLTDRFRVASDDDRLAVAEELAASPREARRMLSELGGDAELRARYTKALRERDLVDFDDLIDLPVALLSAEPGLAEHYRERFPWTFVDEYQDIDERQYTLLRLLTRPEARLTAIGDPDQAIYGFRGADVGFFLRFRDDYPTASAVQLTRNYRSSPTVVTAARQIIAPATLVRDRALRPTRPDAGPIGVYAAADEQDEASFVARTIDQLLGGSSFHSLDSGRAGDDPSEVIGFSDIAVLYRTAAQARPIMEAFGRAGVPFQKRSHDRLADRPGVAEVVAELRRRGGTRPHDAARAVAARLPASEEELATDIRGAAELLVPLAERCGRDLEHFLTELALGAEVDTLDPRADRASLLTLHAAKGLEFRVVFIVGCEAGLLPLRWPGETRSGDEAEERRLFFVGVTRARSRLFVSHARCRTRQGELRDRRPSPFLAAIDDSLLERDAPARPRRPRDRQLRLL